MGGFVAVFDQALVDVVTGTRGQEAEIEIFPEIFEVGNDIASKPVDREEDQGESDDLNGHGPISGVVNQLAEPEGLGWRFCNTCHWKATPIVAGGATHDPPFTRLSGAPVVRSVT